MKKETSTFDYQSTSELSDSINHILLIIYNMRRKCLLEEIIPSLDIPLQQVIIIDQSGDPSTKNYTDSLGTYYIEVDKKIENIKACNLAIRHALEKKARYIALLNAQSIFQGPVLHYLLETILTEQKIGACAPTQQINPLEPQKTINKVNWNLTKNKIIYDTEKPPDDCVVLESDFFELSCVLIKANIFKEINFFDECFDEHYAAFDFGYQLWIKGHRVVYNQKAKILNYNFSNRLPLLTREQKKIFTKKFPQHGIFFTHEKSTEAFPNSWFVLSSHLNKYLSRYGLLRFDGPILKHAHPHPKIKCNYLSTVWETSIIPDAWKNYLKQYDHVIVPSQWNYNLFKNAQCDRLSKVSHGVDSDIYNPYGKKFEFSAEKAFLVICGYQYRKALEIIIRAWIEIKYHIPNARLYLYVHRIQLEKILGPPDTEITHSDSIKEYSYDELQISYLKALRPLSFHEMAALYRGAYTLITSSRSEGFGLPIIEAMACGTLTIVPDYGATAEFIINNNCIPLSGLVSKAEYSDVGFPGNMGDWWEPSITDLKKCILQACNLSSKDRQSITFIARQFVLSHYTWRCSMLTLRNVLIKTQKIKPKNFFYQLKSIFFNLCIKISLFKIYFDRSKTLR